MTDECIFCKIAAREMPADIVHEDETLVAINDIHPQAPVHVLLMPKRHVATLNDLDEAQAGLIGELTLRGRAIAAERGVADDGYRLVLNCNRGGGQTVFHIHMHLLGGRQLRALG